MVISNLRDKSNNMLVALLLCFVSQTSAALTFGLPTNGDLIGEIQMTTVRRGESLPDIARRYDVGVYEMIEANPTVDPWIPPAGSMVLIPTQFILPNGPRTGIVLNLAEMRLYYYDPVKPIVTTYPIGIGKKGWSTPLATTKVIGKKKDPSWIPPLSIREEHRLKGDILPAIVPGGPDNPLGRYAIYLAMEGSYHIHGTHKPGGIGVRGSHGCMRLYPEDIEALYYTVPIGTTVRIVHEPYKIGWHKNHLYLESHQPLSEGGYANSDSLESLKTAIEKAITGTYTVNWTSAQMAAKAQKGYPMRID